MKLRERQPISVAVADDDLFVRETLSALIAADESFNLVGAAADGHHLLELIRTHHPDVALIDIQMPRIDGMQALSDTKAISPTTQVLMLTSFDDPATIRTSLSRGASGYLLKSARPRAILEAVRAAAAGASVVSPEILDSITPTTGPLPTNVGLTSAETEVLHLLILGQSNAEIAAGLFLSESTVKARLASAATKLGTTSRVATAVRCVQLGIT